MQLSDFIKKNHRVLLFLIIVLFTLFLIGGIFYMNLLESQSPSILISGSKLKGYDQIKKEINDLIANDKTNIGQGYRERISQKLTILENKNSTSQENYTATSQIAVFISSTYSQTHNPKYRIIVDDLGGFAKTNFPKEYYNYDFYTVCQDSSCQDEPEPAEVKTIIDHINASDFPIQVKKSLRLNLENAVYMTKSNRTAKTAVYYQVYKMLTTYSVFSPSGQNVTISSEIKNFIDKTYPEEEKTLLSKPIPTPGKVLKGPYK